MSSNTNRPAARTASQTAAPAAPAPAAPTVSAVAKRASRLPVAGVLAALTAAGPTGLTVPSMAASLAVAERDVRLAIDALRNKKHPIARIAVKTFALPAAAK